VLAAAHSLGVEVVLASAASEDELDAAYAGLAQRNAKGLIVTGDAFFLHEVKRLAALAVQHQWVRPLRRESMRKPAGASVRDSFPKAGVYTGDILKGEKPGDLPVVQPTRFELVINLKAAKAIGLDVPPHLQQLADELIE
jgi:putative tryptophan/tyrosine transport system substrate-binding protein